MIYPFISYEQKRIESTGFKLQYFKVLILALFFCAVGVDAQESKLSPAVGADGQPVPVHDGIAQWAGVDYPIYPGAKEVTSLGDGIRYSFAAANRKASDKLGGQIVTFYVNKKIGTTPTLSEIRKRIYLDETRYANYVGQAQPGSTDRGPSVIIVASENEVKVRP